MKTAANQFFNRAGYTVKTLGRPGVSEADYMLVDQRGFKLPVEEKRVAELKCYSSWWHHWEPVLTDRYTTGGLTSQVRGWIAVIDGQLREWALREDNSGVLLVDSYDLSFGRPGVMVKDSVHAAIGFLSNESRLHVVSQASLPDNSLIIQLKYAHK